MCLTIPAKVKAIKNTDVIIETFNGEKKIKNSLINDLQVNDWILYINELALRKIPADEAHEILTLLENTPSKINLLKLSPQFQQIIEQSEQRILTKQEVVYLLNTTGEEHQALLTKADSLRRTYIKDFICIHGIIEFSNYCTNDCHYCGLNNNNKELIRYRLSPKEIIRIAQHAIIEKGYKLLVLQSGQDPFYTTEILMKIVREIKKDHQVFLILSIGERDFNSYKQLYQSGASGVLFRFETANQTLFEKIHPTGKNWEERFNHLEFLHKLGYFVATGSIIGLPNQTIEDVANDILQTVKWSHMASVGPFIPTPKTPLENQTGGTVDLTIKSMAIIRLMMKQARIPVSTALETLGGENARIQALKAGANSLMFNLTPAKFRPLYKIYPNKFFENETVWQKYGLFKNEESYQMLEDRIARAIAGNNLQSL